MSICTCEGFKQDICHKKLNCVYEAIHKRRVVDVDIYEFISIIIQTFYNCRRIVYKIEKQELRTTNYSSNIVQQKLLKVMVSQ
jgi:hypothetical protein